MPTPLLDRLDPVSRRPIKTPRMRRCLVNLEGEKSMALDAATVQIQRGELRLFDSGGHLCAAVAADCWRSWRFEAAE